MIEESKHIKEYYYIKHRKDKLKHTGFDYEKNIFNKTMSNIMFQNPVLNEFLSYLQNHIILMFDSVLIIRNFWNYTVDRYYNKHHN